MDPKSLFSLNDRLEILSRNGDPLEVLEQTVDFEYFRRWLVEGLGYGDGSTRMDARRSIPSPCSIS